MRARPEGFETPDFQIRSTNRDESASQPFWWMVTRSVDSDSPACGYPRCSMGCLGDDQECFQRKHLLSWLQRTRSTAGHSTSRMNAMTRRDALIPRPGGVEAAAVRQIVALGSGRMRNPAEGRRKGVQAA